MRGRILIPLSLAVFAGRGADKVNAATAGPAARVNCSRGFDKLRINRNERRRARRCERVYVLR